MAPNKLPARKDVPQKDCWDLSSLYTDDAAWEQDFVAWEATIGRYAEFRGRLTESVATLSEFFAFDVEFDRRCERLGTYAFLKTAEDGGAGEYQKMIGRFHNAAARAAETASYIRPELLSTSDERMAELTAAEAIAPFRLALQRMLRYKPHTLTDREERLIAMQAEMAGVANRAFRQLHDVDLKFGTIRDAEGVEIELGHSSYPSLLESPDREVRRTAFTQYYEQFQRHENTLAAVFTGSVQRDVYYARARNYPSSRAAALFPDNVPEAVYDNLVSAVRDRLDVVHRYFDVRRRKMGLDDLHHYDTYVPILSDLKQKRTWDEAVEAVLGSLAPLGDQYRRDLEKGLRGRWCDRYANAGKQSGAFSCGSFDGDPFILMNYQESVLDHVFTLAHEAGHSMHSYYSSRNQPFQYYDYTIFVAEVASTFNEQLLTRHLLENAPDDRTRAYLINKEIDSIRGTIVRQTMFAEFELKTHALVEANEPLTLGVCQEVYRELLEAYFGPDFALDDQLSLECLRIPHFYRAFYVYKYATGLAAAIALSERVVSGGERELQDYLGFLSGGCSQDPLDLLRDAGVDMTEPAPIYAALDRFGELVDELDRLI